MQIPSDATVALNRANRANKVLLIAALRAHRIYSMLLRYVWAGTVFVDS